MRKAIMVSIVCMLVVMFSGCAVSKEEENAESFGKAVKALEKDTVTMQELCEFEWDTLYTVRPYLKKDEIESFIGIKSDKITDTMVNEGMTYLIFVKDEKVVSIIDGPTTAIGYSINFGEFSDDVLKISYEDTCEFSVENVEGIRYLTYQDK